MPWLMITLLLASFERVFTRGVRPLRGTARGTLTRRGRPRTLPRIIRGGRLGFFFREFRKRHEAILLGLIAVHQHDAIIADDKLNSAIIEIFDCLKSRWQRDIFHH